LENQLTESIQTETTNLPIVVGQTEKPKTIIQDPNSKIPRKLKGAYVPKAEKPEHVAMYNYYNSLGKSRSLPRVAREFGKSLPFISVLSRAFRWSERIRDHEKKVHDPVVTATQSKVDASRVKLVAVVGDVLDTLHELVLISKKIKASEDGVLAQADLKRTETLLTALRIFGVEVSKPKDLRYLISVLKDIVDFQGSVPEGPQKMEIANVEKLLIVKDLD
jgi:hypothetical protein